MTNGEAWNYDDLEVLVSSEQIAERVKELGEEITNDYVGKDIVLICILKGAVLFFADIARAIKLHMQMDFLGISSYGDAQKTSGIIRISKDIDTSITGKHVIIAEDIMDSGLTLNHLIKLLEARDPASIKTCCLLDKPSRRECDITPDYCGFVIPDKFVVGFGLDNAGGFDRNIPFVGVVKV